MPNVQISELPAALPLDGSELIPVVQGGITVRTTTGQVATSPNLQQTFLTKNLETSLPNSRFLSTGAGLGLTDGGAQAPLTITLNGASGSLEAAGNGLIAKTASNAVTPRSIAVTGAGLSISNGDGVAGNPTLSLSGLAAAFANIGGTGIVTIQGGTTVSGTTILGTAGQIDVVNGNGIGNPTISLVATGVTSGSYGTGSAIPVFTVDDYGRLTSASATPFAINANQITSGQLPIVRGGTGASSAIGAVANLLPSQSGNSGKVLSTDGSSTYWLEAGGTGTVTSVDVSGGTTGLTTTGGPVTAAGTITLGGTLNVPSGGTGATTLTGYVVGNGASAMTATSTIPATDLSGTVAVSQGGTGAVSLTGYVVGNGTSAMTASATIPTTDLSGTVSNAQLANSSVTINGLSLSLGGSISLTPTDIGAIGSVSGTTDQIDVSQVGDAVTVSISDAPLLVGPVKVKGTGATTITPFPNSMQVWEADDNDFQIVYAKNSNNGSDASADFVAYNDASDINSYFIDMGMNSSNFTSLAYPIFTPNSGYLFTGGGSSGQQADLFIGTSNAASDIIFFTGDVLAANQRALFSGSTGNFLIGTSVDDNSNLLQVAGNIAAEGAAFTLPVTTSSPSITSPANNEFVTKSYVDNATSAGLHIHAPVLVETTGNLNATYTQGGTTFNITTITGGKTVTTSVNHGLSVNDQIWLYSTAGNGLLTNTAYFVYSTPALNQLTLTTSYGGPELTGLTNASGLTYNTRANSGIGAKLTNAGTQVALVIDGVTMASTNRVMVRLQTDPAQNGVYTVTNIGSGSTNWELTRATDANFFSPQDVNGLGEGDYFFTQSGALNAGDSHVLTTPGSIIIGYTGLTYTQFSGAVLYTGGTNIDVTGQTISLTGTVAATNGGTGVNTVTTGDLLYGSAANTWASLPLGIAYKSLTVNASGTQVEWNAVALNQPTAVSGQLGVGNGGTGLSSYTVGDLLYASGTSALSKLPLGSQGQVLIAGASDPTWGGISGGTF
jgi:hypothetical protein